MELPVLPPVLNNVSRGLTTLEVVETSTSGRSCARGRGGGSSEASPDYVRRQLKSVAAARAARMNAAGAGPTHGTPSQRGVLCAVGGGGTSSEPMSAAQLTMACRFVAEAMACVLQVYACSFSDLAFEH